MGIIYAFRLDASENRLCYTHTLFHTKVKWYQLFTINTVNHFLKPFYFQRLMLWEYLHITFKFKFRCFHSLNIYIFWFCNGNLCVHFWKRLIVYQKLAILSKKIKIFKGWYSQEFFLWYVTHVFSLAMPTKNVKKIVFFLKRYILRTQNKNKSKERHRFLGIATYKTCAKFYRNIAKTMLFDPCISYCLCTFC